MAIQIWLKMPIQASKNHVFGELSFDPQTLFLSSRLQKALPYAETRVLSHKRS